MASALPDMHAHVWSGAPHLTRPRLLHICCSSGVLQLLHGEPKMQHVSDEIAVHFSNQRYPCPLMLQVLVLGCRFAWCDPAAAANNTDNPGKCNPKGWSDNSRPGDCVLWTSQTGVWLRGSSALAAALGGRKQEEGEPAYLGTTRASLSCHEDG